MIAFQFFHSMSTVPTVRSSQQRTMITELFKEAGVPLTNLFFTVMVKSVSFELSE